MLSASEAIDSYNIHEYERGHDYFVCLMCGTVVEWEGCISSCGHNLICGRCCQKVMDVLGLRYSDVLRMVKRPQPASRSPETGLTKPQNHDRL